jgi:hypothetical protein
LSRPSTSYLADPGRKPWMPGTRPGTTKKAIFGAPRNDQN